MITWLELAKILSVKPMVWSPTLLTDTEHWAISVLWKKWSNTVSWSTIPAGDVR